LSKKIKKGFSKVVLIEGMDEPMAMTFLPDNRIPFLVERKGDVIFWIKPRQNQAGLQRFQLAPIHQ